MGGSAIFLGGASGKIGINVERCQFSQAWADNFSSLSLTNSGKDNFTPFLTKFALPPEISMKVKKKL